MARIHASAFVLVAFVTVWAPTALHAQFLPAVNLGATSFLDGGPPAGPGVYLNEYLQFYGAHRIIGPDGNALPLPDPELASFASLTQLIFLSDHEIEWLRAKPALDVLLPVATVDLDYATPGPFPRDGGGGLGDLVIGPALQFDPILRCGKPFFIHRLEAQFLIPTGEYSRAAEINVGSHFFSFDPYWAGTVFLGEKLTASYRVHYLWNGVNHDPPASLALGKLKAGDAFHMNFAAAYRLAQPLRVGINGYWLKQTTDTQFDGVDVPGTREQVFAVGPGAIFSISERQHIFANVYVETDARNRPEGTRLTVRYTHKF